LLRVFCIYSAGLAAWGRGRGMGALYMSLKKFSVVHGEGSGIHKRKKHAAEQVLTSSPLRK